MAAAADATAAPKAAHPDGAVGGIVPIWNPHGQPDDGIVADGTSQHDGGLALCDSAPCHRSAGAPWPLGGFAYDRPRFVQRSWFGSLLEDQQDKSGTLYRRARQYDPATGRFTQEDPIGLAGGVNAYGFANEDPTTFEDPFGLDPCPSLERGNCTQSQDGDVVQSKKREEVAFAVAMAVGPMMGAALTQPDQPNGQFSVSDWSGYPEGVPIPEGPFVLLEGDEYAASRAAANSANKSLHAANPELKGLHLHEIQPVKFGGDPTSPANKLPLEPSAHYTLNAWWNALLLAIKIRY